MTFKLFLVFSWSVVALTVFAAPTLLAADKTPDEVLRAKGLTRIGQKYVLEGDAALPDWLRQVRAAEKKVQEAVKRRSTIERDIRGMEKAADSLYEEWKSEKEKLKKLSKNADVTYNKQVDKVNNLRARILDGLDQIKKRTAVLQTIGDPADEYVTITMKFGVVVDATIAKYKVVGEDAAVTAAIDSVNKTAVAKYALGPSDRLTAELPAIQKLRDQVNTDTIKFDVGDGVATVSLTLNGDVVTPAIVDSGASYVSISEGLAKKINLSPGPNDRKIHIVTADGTVSEVHLMVIKSVRLGKFAVENVECVIVPSKGREVDTLLGGSFLKHFVYKMDLSAGQLKLSQVSEKPLSDLPNAAVSVKPAGAGATPTSAPSSEKPQATKPPAKPSLFGDTSGNELGISRKEYDFSKPGTLDFFDTKGNVTIMPSGEMLLSNGDPSMVTTKQIYSYPIRIEADACTLPGGNLDIGVWTLIGGNDKKGLGLHLGNSYNKFSNASVYAVEKKFDGMKIEVGKVYKIVMTIDEKRKAEISVDGNVMVSAIVPDDVKLEGKVVFFGGRGKVVYKRCSIVGKIVEPK